MTSYHFLNSLWCQNNSISLVISVDKESEYNYNRPVRRIVGNSLQPSDAYTLRL